MFDFDFGSKKKSDSNRHAGPGQIKQWGEYDFKFKFQAQLD